MPTTHNLPLPKSITKLVAEGRWPANSDESRRQNLTPLVSPERVRAIVSEEEGMLLLPPPLFYTVAAAIAAHRERYFDSLANPIVGRRTIPVLPESFWEWPTSALGEIDADLTLVIAEFFIGSDSPIALDYRRGIDNPSVIRLNHALSPKPVENHWVELAPTFDEFVRMFLD